MSAQEHSPDFEFDPDSSAPYEENPPKTAPQVSSVLVYAGVFVVGLLVGWFVLGWYLFPVKYTEIYPNDLRPDIADDYILMAAEAYAATNDLRTAAKRLRYWEPEELAVEIKQMAQALEKVEPERSAYLQLLAKDLHLSATPIASPQATPSPSRTGSPRSLPLSSLLGLLAFLALLGLALYLAQRRGLLRIPQRVTPAETVEETPAPVPQTPSNTTYQDIPVHSMPVETNATGPRATGMTAPSEADFGEGEEEVITPLPYEFTPLPERESVLMPDSSDEPPEEEAPWELDFEEASLDESPEDFENHIEAPEDFTTVPAPPASPDAEEEEPSEESGSEFGKPRTIQFDGSPDYNVIVPIEIDNDFGQFVLGVAITAPHNPNQVLALEALLYDRNDIRTVSALLAPAVLANDPDLLRKFTDQERGVFVLQPGAPFHLETTYLTVTGKVRRVQFGPHTNDGVPVIEFAEIEFVAQRAGEAL